MTSTVRALLEDGETEVLLGVEPDADGRTNAGPAEQVIESIRKATSPAVRAAKEVLDTARAEARPDEAEVTFMVKVSTEADVMIARAATEGSFQVRLLWHASTPAEGTTSPSAR